MTGRPSEFTQDMADRICAEIAGGSNLNKLSQLEGFPSRETMYKWMRAHDAFADTYARARCDRADFRSDRIDDIVNRMIAGEIDANAARVAIDAEKWQAGKENQRRYGDKVAVGGDLDGAPIQVTWAAGEKA